ncbi:MAG: hypothetical protein ACPGYV_09920, partial [Phycisphaeraceae bacterium]
HLLWLMRVVMSGLPRTRLHWGVLAIGCAFACLVIGALIVWWRSERERDGPAIDGVAADRLGLGSANVFDEG